MRFTSRLFQFKVAFFFSGLAFSELAFETTRQLKLYTIYGQLHVEHLRRSVGHVYFPPCFCIHHDFPPYQLRHTLKLKFTRLVKVS